MGPETRITGGLSTFWSFVGPAYVAQNPKAVLWVAQRADYNFDDTSYLALQAIRLGCISSISLRDIQPDK